MSKKEKEKEKEANEISNFIKIMSKVILFFSFILILISLIYSIIRVS